MTDLNKVNYGDVERWQTADYELETAPDNYGYLIVNRHTGAVEGAVDQEPAAVMSMLYLQDAYTDVMADPLREYKLRKQRSERPPAGSKTKIIN